jgi:nucleoside-diphosphate-sugar epimerase
MLKELGATPHVLDLTTASVDDIVKLFKETKAEAVVNCASADDVRDAKSVKAVDYEGGLKVIQAAEKAGVPRFLTVSSMGVHDPDKMPGYYSNVSCLASKIMWQSDSAMRPFLEAKWQLESALHKTKLKFTVLRPGTLFDNYETGCRMGALNLVRDGSTVSPPSLERVLDAMPPTSRELVAQTLYACLRNEDSAGLTLDVVNGHGEISEELSIMTASKTDVWKEDQKTRDWDEATAKKESEDNAEQQKKEHPGPKIVCL